MGRMLMSQVEWRSGWQAMRHAWVISAGLVVCSLALSMRAETARGEDAPPAKAESTSETAAKPDSTPRETNPGTPAEAPKPAAAEKKPVPPPVPIVEMPPDEVRREGASTYALIVIGHPGDAAFAEEFDLAANQIRRFLRDRLAVSEQNIRQLSSAAPGAKANRAAASVKPAASETGSASSVPPKSDAEDAKPDASVGDASPTEATKTEAAPQPATRDAVRELITAEKQRIPPDATVWVVVMGHAHIDGRGAAINLSGPDLSMLELGQWLNELPGRRQVVWLTQPLSGYAVQPLKRAGRVVIAATEADVESNGTMFHQSLGDALNTVVADIDHDGDGRLTLLDLYVEVNRNLARRYAANMSLPTEHAQLDDNGDGTGTEVQVDYLTAEFGGRRGEQPPSPRIVGRDGYVASRWQLPLRRPEPTPPAEPEKEAPPAAPEK